jgi:hypothetical protein
LNILTAIIHFYISRNKGLLETFKPISITAFPSLHPCRINSKYNPQIIIYCYNHSHNGTACPTQPKEIKNAKEFLSLLKDGKSGDKTKKVAKKSTPFPMQPSTSRRTRE